MDLAISIPVLPELILPEIRRRQCRFPTILFWGRDTAMPCPRLLASAIDYLRVGTRHCRLLRFLHLVQVNSSFLSHNFQALMLQGFNCLRGDVKSHPAFLLRPPNPLPLQICFLQLVSAVVRVRNCKTVIRFLPR